MSKNPKRPTISDVAKLAGVSNATVSRVLQNPEVVSAATRKTVTEAVKSIGYRANTAAQMLRRNRANTVLVILPDLANTFFSEILSGIENVASEANLTILIGNSNNDSARCLSLLENLWNGRADGALLLNGALPDAEDRYEGKPIVSISETISGFLGSHVGTNNELAAMDATQFLIDMGHRKIAHISGPKDNILSAQRMAGFDKAVSRADIAANCISIDGDFASSTGASAATNLMKNHAEITAVFCANDEMAMGLVSELAENGIGVPDQLSVIGFDDINFASIYRPSITTIRQDRFEMGRKAMSLLVSQITNEAATPVEVYIPYKLMERDTVKRIT